MSSHDDVGYFAAPGPATVLDAHAERLDSLPSNPAGLGEVVRGLLLHNWTAGMSGIELSPERDGMATFGATPALDRIVALDPGPLDQERPAEERLIGYCYHFALVHCAFLRGKGVPARTRCGFANYLDDGKWTDHWVVEHWDGDTWRLNDPQIGFDDLSHENFRNGVRAWQLCRAGESDPAIHGNGELWGWDELRGSLVNDIGSLNKVEVGDWDWCELLKVEPLDQPHVALDARLDDLAAAADSAQPLANVRSAFRNDEAIRPPEHLVVG